MQSTLSFVGKPELQEHVLNPKPCQPSPTVHQEKTTPQNPRETSYWGSSSSELHNIVPSGPLSNRMRSTNSYLYFCCYSFVLFPLWSFFPFLLLDCWFLSFVLSVSEILSRTRLMALCVSLFPRLSHSLSICRSVFVSISVPVFDVKGVESTSLPLVNPYPSACHQHVLLQHPSIHDGTKQQK